MKLNQGCKITWNILDFQGGMNFLSNPLPDVKEVKDMLEASMIIQIPEAIENYIRKVGNHKTCEYIISVSIDEYPGLTREVRRRRTIVWDKNNDFKKLAKEVTFDSLKFVKEVIQAVKLLINSDDDL